MSTFNYEANEKLAVEAEQDGDAELALGYRTDAEEARQAETVKKEAVGVVPKGDLNTYGDSAVQDWEQRLQHAAQGSSFGFANDAYGVVTTAVEQMFQSDNPDLSESDNNLFYGGDLTMAKFWDASRERTEESAAEMSAWAAKNQGEALLFEIVGGVLTGGAGLAKGAQIAGAKVAATTGAGKVGAAALGTGVAGGVEGFAYGVGTLDARFDDMTAQAEHIAMMTALGTAGGAVIGGAIGGVVKGVKAINTKQAAVRKVHTERDADAVIDLVNEAYITARIDNPNATPLEMNEILKNSDVGTMFDPEMIKAAVAAGTQRLSIPNKATYETLAQYRAISNARNFDDTPTNWLSRKLDSKNNAAMGALDDLVGAVHTRITNISPKMGAALTRNAFDTAEKTQTRMTRVKGIERLDRKGNEALKSDIHDMMLNDDVVGVFLALERHGDDVMTKAFKEAQLINGEFAREFREVGMEVVNRQGGYWGRVVTDPAGLKKLMGSSNLKAMEMEIIKYANKKAGKGRAFGVKDINAARQSINDAEYQSILNSYIKKGMLNKGKDGKVSAAAATQSRSIDDPLNAVTDAGETVNLRGFYADPIKSITNNIRRNTENIEERRLFGTKTGSTDDVIDVDASVKKYLEESDITDVTQIEQLQELLVSRFTMGKVAPKVFNQQIKNIGLMSVLATPKAAAIQIADLGHAVLMSNLKNTVKAVMQKSGITREAIGQGNKIGIEFDSGGTARWDSKAMDKLLNNRVLSSIGVKKNGDEFGILGTKADGRGRGIGTFFGLTDGFGKETFMKARFNKLQQTMKSPAGRNSFVKEYGIQFGRDTRALMDEIASGNAAAPSPNLKLLMYTELAKIQPLDLSHMSQKYLDHPNGRIVYTLKSFALKQLDIMRRRVAQPLAKGNTAEAAQFMAMYTTITGGATYATNEVRNAVFSFGADPVELPAVEDIPAELMWHIVAATGFLNRYNVGDLKSSGNPIDVLAGGAVPPLGTIEGVIKDSWKTFVTGWDEDEFEFANLETVKQIPGGAGLMINMLFGDGQEKKEAQAQTRADDAYEAKYGRRPRRRGQYGR